MKRETLLIRTSGEGLFEITDEVQSFLKKTGSGDGMVNVFCLHTSCSLVLMENADPSALHDLERFLRKMVPENDPDFTHTMEGPDDMPSHIKMALTRTSEVLPVEKGRLLLGTWQGLFLWEHRRAGSSRKVVLSWIPLSGEG